MVLKLRKSFTGKNKKISFKTHTPPLSLLLFSYIKISPYTSCSAITFGNGKDSLSIATF